ncbi:citrate synthase family protein [Mycobacterium xenopi 3993]|nr:citrate synthase family protein [Mycobacterium xenopi 3993]
MMPAMFTCGRTAGWCAHILEQKQLGKLVRPSAIYVGPDRVARSRSKAGTRFRKVEATRCDEFASVAGSVLVSPSGPRET